MDGVVADRAISVVDRFLNAILAILIILLMLYGTLSLVDAIRTYYGAGVDRSILQYKPDLNGDGSNPSLAELMAINPDVIGWITLDGTKIDYPFVQGKDNEKYVNTDIYGKFSFSGTVFLDAHNKPDFSDGYSILYGHHMELDAMFGPLEKYRDADFFDKNTTGTLYLKDRTFRIEIFACCNCDAYEPDLFDVTIANDNLDHVKSRIEETALQYRDAHLAEGDRIIGLYTCADAGTNTRTLVYGKLVPIMTTNESKQAEV